MNVAVGSVVAVLAASSIACTPRFDPAQFEGSRQSRRAEPEAVQELAARTDRLEILGRVHISCRLEPGFRALDQAPLSDVDCGPRRLSWALRESGADAGGEVLVGLRCESRRTSESSRATYLVGCAADVARFRAGMLASPLAAPRSVVPGVPAPSSSDVERSDEPDASLAFRILVSFRPAVASFVGRLRAGAEVNELPLLPIADQPLGDLVASCAGACDERALRYGVLLAAGRLGAPDVIGVRCFVAGSRASCVGTLAAPSLNE